MKKTLAMRVTSFALALSMVSMPLPEGIFAEENINEDVGIPAAENVQETSVRLTEGAENGSSADTQDSTEMPENPEMTEKIGGGG